jgi:hypothetical protein
MATALWFPTIATCTIIHTELTNLMGNLCCATEHSVKFFVHFFSHTWRNERQYLYCSHLSLSPITQVRRSMAVLPMHYLDLKDFRGQQTQILSLTLSLTHSLTHTHSLTLSQSLNHPLTLSLSLTHSLTPLSHSLSHYPLTHSLTLSLTLSLSLHRQGMAHNIPHHCHFTKRAT